MKKIILGPIITEKSMNDATLRKFTFRVEKHANKTQIRKEIEIKFKVNVVNISTSIVKGKKIRTGSKRMERKVADFKKAIVTLKEGQKIGLFELGGEESK